MKIEIIDQDKEIFSNGESILSNLIENKVDINNFCNGRGTCGKCKVKILEGNTNPLSSEEKSLLSPAEQKDNIRLACLAYPLTDLKISIDRESSDIKVLDQGQIPDFEMDLRDGFGIALDIGTTTLAMNLIDLSDGKIVDKVSAINAQSKYGLDVMTRISYEYDNESGIDHLKEAIVDSINTMIRQISSKNKVEKKEIKQMVVAANTTMAHMLLGVDAKPLGRYPYQPNLIETQRIMAKDIGDRKSVV